MTTIVGHMDEPEDDPERPASLPLWFTETQARINRTLARIAETQNAIDQAFARIYERQARITRMLNEPPWASF